MAAVANSHQPWRAVTAWAVALAVFLWIFPPFHVRPLSENAPSREETQRVDATTGAQELWKQMQEARSRAVDVETLLATNANDPKAAERQYGRRIGYGGPAFYFVYGQGRVAEITRKGVLLDIEGQPTRVKLITGPVFGNSLRDATDLADMRRFDSFQFNALSSEINLLSEQRVQPRLTELAKPGETLRFVGGARYSGRGSNAMLEVVAIDVGSDR